MGSSSSDTHAPCPPVYRSLWVSSAPVRCTSLPLGEAGLHGQLHMQICGQRSPRLDLPPQSPVPRGQWLDSRGRGGWRRGRGVAMSPPDCRGRWGIWEASEGARNARMALPLLWGARQPWASLGPVLDPPSCRLPWLCPQERGVGTFGVHREMKQKELRSPGDAGA